MSELLKQYAQQYKSPLQRNMEATERQGANYAHLTDGLPTLQPVTSWGDSGR